MNTSSCMSEFKFSLHWYLHRMHSRRRGVIRAATHSSVILVVFLHSTCLYASGSEHRARSICVALLLTLHDHINITYISSILAVTRIFRLYRILSRVCSQEVGTCMFLDSLEGHDFSDWTVPVGRLSAESFCWHSVACRFRNALTTSAVQSAYQSVVIAITCPWFMWR